MSEGSSRTRAGSQRVRTSPSSKSGKSRRKSDVVSATKEARESTITQTASERRARITHLVERIPDSLDQLCSSAPNLYDRINFSCMSYSSLIRYCQMYGLIPQSYCHFQTLGEQIIKVDSSDQPKNEEGTPNGSSVSPSSMEISPDAAITGSSSPRGECNSPSPSHLTDTDMRLTKTDLVQLVKTHFLQTTLCHLCELESKEKSEDHSHSSSYHTRSTQGCTEEYEAGVLLRFIQYLGRNQDDILDPRYRDRRESQSESIPDTSAIKPKAESEMSHSLDTSVVEVDRGASKKKSKKKKRKAAATATATGTQSKGGR